VAVAAADPSGGAVVSVVGGAGSGSVGGEGALGAVSSGFSDGSDIDALELNGGGA
jgi:hypothetical protein